jgi:hypothetical protein
MADSHGHDAHDAHDDHAHDDHAHDDHHEAPDPDEATLRTPLWLPFVGIGLLTLFAVVVFNVVGSSGRGAQGDGADAGTPPVANSDNAPRP